MAWASMHFAVGMGCVGLAGAGVCLLARRGWRWLPLAMTAGGIWAMGPDLPRMFREDFPNAPLARWLGHRDLQAFLNRHADWFFAHGQLDSQPKEFALHGLFLIIALYTLCILGLMWQSHRQGRKQRKFERLMQRPAE